MGRKCCDHGIHLLSHPHHQDHSSSMTDHQRRLLWTVLWVNVAMSGIEGVGGWLAHSNSVLADSIHLLGHVFIVGLSIFSLSRGIRWKARAALLNGLMNIGLGVMVLVEATANSFHPSSMPAVGAMSVIGIVTALANLTCLFLLASHKDDDINMQATWLCSRNDLLTNAGIIVTSACVVISRSHWPDTVVAVLLATIVLGSAARISKRALLMLLKPAAAGMTFTARS